MYELTYSAARAHIKTGDIVAISGNKLTAWAQRNGWKQWGGNRYAHYTHIGIAVWQSDHTRQDGKVLSLYSMDGRFNTFQALSQFKDHDMCVFRTGIEPSVIEDAIYNDYAYKRTYDVPSFLTIGIRMFTGLLLKNTDKSIVCSEIVRIILQRVGFKFTSYFPKNPSVNEMCNALFVHEMPWRINA